MAKGKAKITGDEQFIPGTRSRLVARTYVEGLERDRKELLRFEHELNSTIWEAVQLGAYSRALRLNLGALYTAVETGTIPEGLMDQIADLLEDSGELHESIYECECGHSKYDHDENGCQFLGCIPICGYPKKETT